MIRENTLFAAVLLTALVIPAGLGHAEVVAQSEAGFVVKLSVDAAASPVDT